MPKSKTFTWTNWKNVGGELQNQGWANFWTGGPQAADGWSVFVATLLEKKINHGMCLKCDFMTMDKSKGTTKSVFEAPFSSVLKWLLNHLKYMKYSFSRTYFTINITSLTSVGHPTNQNRLQVRQFVHVLARVSVENSTTPKMLIFQCVYF